MKRQPGISGEVLTYKEMGETLTGELVPRSVPFEEPPTAQPPARRSLPRTWTVYYVSWGYGTGTIEGMDRADALRLAEELGGQAYAAAAQLTEHNVVMVGPWEPISV